MHRIASDYGGEVRVASQQGKGTSVEVALPLGTDRHRDQWAVADGPRRTPDMAGTVAAERAATASESARILVVDDERSMREMLAILLKREGHEVSVAENGRAAIELLNQRPFDLVVSDARMPDLDGLEVLRHARSINPSVIAIMVTAYGSPDLLRGVAQLGVNDYVEKPFNTEVLRFRIRKELDRKRLQQENVLLKRAMHSANQFENIIGNSSAMLQVFELVETIAPTGSTVLITGESGTGKELVARAIHVRSPRSDRPFVAVNCGALTETLLDSELFGHMRGSFTGADGNRKGLIEVADKGTIFLDEIGEMSPMLQVKILRVLQERKFRRVGGNEEVEADIRIIAATNRDLAEDGRRRGSSARTCSTGSTSSRCGCRRCGSGSRTCRCSPSTSSPSSPSR